MTIEASLHYFLLRSQSDEVFRIKRLEVVRDSIPYLPLTPIIHGVEELEETTLLHPANVANLHLSAIEIGLPQWVSVPLRIQLFDVDVPWLNYLEGHASSRHDDLRRHDEVQSSA